MAKQKRRKSFYAPGPVVWRVLFGRNGPTKSAMRKAWREWTGPRTVASVRFDPDRNKVVAKGALKRRPDGTFVYAPPKAKRVTTAQRVANVQQRIAEESDRHAAAQRSKPAPMTERVKRKSDGTFNGSAKVTPAEREAARLARSADATYARAAKSAAASERRIRRDLGH
jgi:hypothetical protein